LTWIDSWVWSCGLANSINWKGFNSKKSSTGKKGLQTHFEEHGYEFGNITQN